MSYAYVPLPTVLAAYEALTLKVRKNLDADVVVAYSVVRQGFNGEGNDVAYDGSVAWKRTSPAEGTVHGVHTFVIRATTQGTLRADLMYGRYDGLSSAAEASSEAWRCAPLGGRLLEP